MDGDTPSVYKEEYRYAKKEHICCECHRPIPVRAKYQFAKGCWEGKWLAFRTCLACAELRDEFEYAPFGYLGEWAAESDITFPPEYVIEFRPVTQ